MNWTSVELATPKPAERVLALNDKGWQAGRYIQGRVVNGVQEPMRWVDDQSLPIRGVTHWTAVVAPDETA